MKKPGWMVGEVLRNAARPSATQQYPAAPVRLPAAFRGKIRFTGVRCVGCKLCQKDCPSNALTITKVGDKRFQAEFDLGRCIYCAQCVDSCNKDALESTPEFELATLDRRTLRVTFDAPPAPQPSPEAKKPEAPKPAAPDGGEPAAVAPARPAP